MRNARARACAFKLAGLGLYAAMAVKEGRKEIANLQESPHPSLEVNPFCTVLRGRNKMERKWG